MDVELVTRVDGDILLHLRVPRGQTIDSVQVSQGANNATLEVGQDPLPLMQFILLDAGGEMVNLQPVVQSAIPRFWASTDRETGLIFFNAALDSLQPTDRAEQLDDFLSGYAPISGDPACLATALDDLATRERDIDRAWRILIVTAGDFSQQSTCDVQTFPVLPAPVDIIAVTTTVDEMLETLVAESGGVIYTANLRGVEARTNEVTTSWAQPTYAVRGTLPPSWEPDAPFDMTITLSNGTEETQTLSLRTYNLPATGTDTQVAAPVTSEPEPTSALSTIPPDATATPVANAITDPTAVPTLASTAAPPTTSAAADNTGPIAIALIVGAVLFVIGAVGLALSLTRVRRAPAAQPAQPANYYQALTQPTSEQGDEPTRIRERDILANNNEQTQIAEVVEATAHFSDDEEDDEDTMLMTQVLTDERFQEMVASSQSDDEVVGWMRILIDGETDITDKPLTMRGAVIGRSQECDIQITDDRAISRKHARLDVAQDRQVTISRLSATNPVVVGGVQISNRHLLKPNDVIYLSDMTKLIFIAKDTNNDDDPADEKTRDLE